MEEIVITHKNNNSLNNTRDEQDTAWKDILDAYFKDCVHYCFSELDKLINWEETPISLDKELQAITRGSETGKRLLDKLFKVFLKEGREQWVLIHLEVQATQDNDFPKRMFTYGHRIWDKYQQPLVSCAILTDDKQDWRPNSYEVKFAGSRLSAEFLVVKLIDFRKRQKELEESANPFAAVILVQLAALDAKSKSGEERRDIKYRLSKRLYEKQFSKQEISNLYPFIDWLIGLPKELELDYLQNIYDLEESIKMAYITSAEKYGFEVALARGLKKEWEKGLEEGLEKGLEKGRQEGIEQGKLETAKRLISEEADPAFIARVTVLPLKKIKELQEMAELE